MVSLTPCPRPRLLVRCPFPFVLVQLVIGAASHVKYSATVTALTASDAHAVFDEKVAEATTLKERLPSLLIEMGALKVYMVMDRGQARTVRNAFRRKGSCVTTSTTVAFFVLTFASSGLVKTSRARLLSLACCRSILIERMGQNDKKVWVRQPRARPAVNYEDNPTAQGSMGRTTGRCRRPH